MSYCDNTKKWKCVLNMQRPIPQLMNALAHVTAGLAAGLPAAAGEYLAYPNDADGFVASISRFPFIVLKSRNSAQLATLRKLAAAQRVPCNVFVSAMLGGSAKEQLANTLGASGEALEYVAVALFGEAEVVDPLTRKFSLFALSQQ